MITRKYANTYRLDGDVVSWKDPGIEVKETVDRIIVECESCLNPITIKDWPALQLICIFVRVPPILDVEHCPLLEAMSLDACNSAECHLQPLQRLVLSSWSDSQFARSHFPACCVLTISEGNNTGCVNIADFSKLTAISIDSIKSMSKLPDWIGNATELQTISIEHCFDLRDCSILAKCSALKDIDIWNCPQLETVKHLKSLENIVHLTIGGTSNVRDGDLEFLIHLNSLEEISLEVRSHYNVKVSKNPGHRRDIIATRR